MSKARFPWVLAGVLIFSWAAGHAAGLAVAVAVLAVLYWSSVRLSPRTRHARCGGTGQKQGVLFSWVHRRCGGCQSGRVIRWGAGRFGSPEVKAEAARNRAALDAAKAGHRWR